METRDNQKKRITINDIARVSGYSKTAISFAFNDPSRISEEACRTILSVAEQLGYYPDPLARRFSLQRYESIGFLLPQDFHHSFRNPYIMRVVEGIGAVCHEHAHTLTLIPPVNESVTDAIKGAAVDGLIIQGMHEGMKIAKAIAKRGLPFVSIDGIPSDHGASVNIDDRSAAREIMRTVLDAGHRSIAIIGLSPVSYEQGNTESIQDRRLQGYREALRERDLDIDASPITLMMRACTLEDGIEVAEKIASLPTRPTCILTMSDILAIGIMLRMPQLDISIPSDISIAGFDDIQEASYLVPGITTVHQPSFEKGKEAARLLFWMMQGGSARHIELPHHLVMRDTVRSIT